MDQPRANPYAPPSVDVSESTGAKSTGTLRPLWIWLAIAAGASVLGTPADPISMAAALATGLVCFCVGAIFGSSLPWIARAVSLVLCIGFVSGLAISLGGPFSFVGTIVYGLASIGMGVWACRRIQHGRLRILTCFCTGYVLGSFLGVLGTVVGAVTAAVVAKRSLWNLESPEDR